MTSIRTARGSRQLVAALLFFGAAVFASSLTACSKYAPPMDPGVCNEGREWVPPQQGENGRWRDGYCRDIGAR